MTSTPSPLGGGGSGVGAPASLPSSPSSAPNEKSRRYDRQLRLWGDHGQRSLERASICLVGGANATGCETLKSLVLPGVGGFTIVDDKMITKEDVGNNFFLELDKVGQPRGAVATELLLEMNNEVRGEFVEESVAHILNDRPEFFKTFTIVIATDPGEKALRQLSTILWEANIPLMVVRSYGFIGYIRMQIQEHRAVETHPDNQLEDFRLDRPFPGLVKYAENLDLDAMTKQEHSHTPYLVILYKFLQKWRESTGGTFPKNYKEKKQIKELISEGKRVTEHGHPEDEENFDEAVAAVNTSLVPYSIPSQVKEIFADGKCSNLTAKSSDFWVICRGVKDFVESADAGNGYLPLKGTIPDMFADSDRYIQLQNVYREKAAEDAEVVLRLVQRHLEDIGRSTESISESDVKKFCREANNIRVIRSGCSIEEEYSGCSPHAAALAKLFEEDPESQVMYYFIARGSDRFQSEYNETPGALDDQVEPDIGKLKTCVGKVLSEYGSSIACKDDYVHEMCRYGGCELNAIASVIGGCAAQEAIKLITKQYVPINNLFIFNTMTSETVSVKV